MGWRPHGSTSGRRTDAPIATRRESDALEELHGQPAPNSTPIAQTHCPSQPPETGARQPSTSNAAVRETRPERRAAGPTLAVRLSPSLTGPVDEAANESRVETLRIRVTRVGFSSAFGGRVTLIASSPNQQALVGRHVGGVFVGPPQDRENALVLDPVAHLAVAGTGGNGSQAAVASSGHSSALRIQPETA